MLIVKFLMTDLVHESLYDNVLYNSTARELQELTPTLRQILLQVLIRLYTLLQEHA